MRICAVEGMIIMMVGSLAMAHDNYGQLLDRKITMNVENRPLQDALHEIETVSGIKFFYSIDQLSFFENVTLRSFEEPLGDILARLLSPHQISFKVYEKISTIILKRIPPAEITKGSEKLRSEVTGTVTDTKNKEGLAGVNIIVKGTTNGTTTDANGKFLLLAEDNDILIFSFIGYKEFETAINGRSIIDVALLEDISALNEVVINAGYWQIKEKEETGNIARITSEDIQKQPVSNPLEALIGRMPGVVITQQTGVSGGGFSVQIRGRSSISGLGNPLYIVDGVPFGSTSLASSALSGQILGDANPLNAINPADIESIEVLKDGDATAIYGSRGANGVVLITTKKGKAGKTKFDLTFYEGAGKISRSMNLLNTPQWLAMRHEAFKNDGAKPGASDFDLTTWDTTRNTNWQKKLIGGIAHTTSAQVAMSGGNNNTQFLIGAGFYRQGTVFPGTFADQKVSAHFNLTHRSENNKFRAGITASYLDDTNDLPSQDLTYGAITLSPDAPALYDKNGNLNWENSTWNNPLATFLKPIYKGKTDNLIANSNLSYEFIPGLQLKANLGYTSAHLDQLSTIPISSVNPAFPNQTGTAIFASSEISTWIAEPQLQYQHSVGGGTLSALSGATFQQSLQKGQSEIGFGYVNDELLQNLEAASSIFAFDVKYSQYRYNAFFGRLNYNYKGKYIVNATGRRDGSSRFGPDRRFANFGAVGAAWIFTSEEFFRNKSVLSFGKLRGSYGITGSDQIGDYQYLNSYSSTSYPYNGVAGLIPTRLANPNYSWESNKKFEAGLELGFFNDQIQFMSSYYRNRSSNQLVGYSLPAITGQTSIQYNLPAVVQNTGFEFLLSYSPVKTAGFSWTTSVNLTLPKNVLIQYPNLPASPYADTYVIGKPLTIAKKFHNSGVDPATGLYQFTDVDKDGTLSYPNDSQTTKNIGQTLYGGWMNSFRYKGFKLEIFLQFVKQQGYNYLNGFSTPGTNYSNQPTIVLNRWQKPGDQASIQKFTQSDPDALTAFSNAAYYSDKVISDASFIRLKNLSFSYQIPPPLTSRMKLQSLRFYVQGQNLLTMTRYIGFDPENKNASVLPPLRILTGGFNLTF